MWLRSEGSIWYCSHKQRCFSDASGEGGCQRGGLTVTSDLPLAFAHAWNVFSTSRVEASWIISVLSEDVESVIGSSLSVYLPHHPSVSLAPPRASGHTQHSPRLAVARPAHLLHNLIDQLHRIVREPNSDEHDAVRVGREVLEPRLRRTDDGPVGSDGAGFLGLPLCGLELGELASDGGFDRLVLVFGGGGGLGGGSGGIGRLGGGGGDVADWAEVLEGGEALWRVETVGDL